MTEKQLHKLLPVTLGKRLEEIKAPAELATMPDVFWESFLAKRFILVVWRDHPSQRGKTVTALFNPEKDQKLEGGLE